MTSLRLSFLCFGSLTRLTGRGGWLWGAVFGLLLAGELPAASLPRSEPHQQVLCDYLGSLKESDFDPGQIREDADPAGLSGEALYRSWLLAQRGGAYGLQAPSSAYLLSSIESGDKVMQPMGVELARMAKMYPDKYEHPRALRMRAFVPSVVDLLMLEDLYGQPAGKAVARFDFLGGTLIWLAYNYGEVKADLPEDVRKAYETGLRKMVARLKEWGPTGLHTNMDLFAPVGLAYAARALDDPEITRTATEIARTLYTDPRHFNPAGFFVEENGFDTSYNGIALFFSTWAGLISDWDFVQKALDQTYKLRAHLSLPEPPEVRDKSGNRLWFGPTHFSTRTSGDSPSDQWGWTDRNVGASLLTDHALPLVPLPAEEVLRNPRREKGPPSENPAPWKEHHWIRSNLATEFHKPGFYDRLLKLHAEDSPLVKLPFDRPGGFVEQFGDTFVVAKFPRYGVIIFSGQVSSEYTGIARGFGGGNVSAFWMPDTGPVLLGRRGGTQGDHPDRPEAWRDRPVNAISGQTDNGKMFSSSRCLVPERTIQTSPEGFDVTVKGTMGTYPERIKLRGTMTYQRRFTGDADGVTVESSVHSDTKDVLAEMVETIPFFLKDAKVHRAEAPPPFGFEFQVGSTWSEATAEPVDNVTAIRVHRHRGAVEVRLEKPSRVRLSPNEWTDLYHSRAICRNVLIDYPLPDKPGEPFEARMTYRIVPAEVPAAGN